MNTFKIIGAVGLLLISIGIVLKNRKKQNLFYISGGICLEIYSIYLQDLIFMILQIVFILTAIYDLIKIKLNKHEHNK
jgi:lipid-A-disaccharide synthase-like uncharacterized protein